MENVIEFDFITVDILFKYSFELQIESNLIFNIRKYTESSKLKLSDI
jgi:hypothetical protein